jgi:hypothetical protein
MTESAVASGVSWWKTPRHWWAAFFAQREGRVLLILSILIGAMTGLTVVAFIHLTERIGLRLYPVGTDRWAWGICYSVILPTRANFRTFTPTIRWIWRSNAWARRGWMSCP